METQFSDWLVLTPTAFERERAVEIWRQGAPEACTPDIEVIGFGPIISAAKTAQLISEHTPRHVLLIGIAGSYNDKLAIGQAFQCSRVACYGVGVGSGNGFQTAHQMGWQQWEGNIPGDAIGDTIELETTATDSDNAATSNESCLLLTAPAASGNDQDVSDRLLIFPNASAEDMEGFAVAAACRLLNVPLSIVRGISNRAGDRDKTHWQIDDALRSAVELSQRIMAVRS